MTMKHKSQGFLINVTSRHGKPIVNNRGLVDITKGQYKRCTEIQADVLLEKFEVKV